MTLVVAGHETTASTLNWAWYLLARHPFVEQRLSREIEDKPLELGALARCTYTKQVIEEVLRLYPPGWLLTRRAIETTRSTDILFMPGSRFIFRPILSSGTRNIGCRLLISSRTTSNPPRWKDAIRWRACRSQQDRGTALAKRWRESKSNCICTLFAATL